MEQLLLCTAAPPAARRGPRYTQRTLAGHGARLLASGPSIQSKQASKHDEKLLSSTHAPLQETELISSISARHVSCLGGLGGCRGTGDAMWDLISLLVCRVPAEKHCVFSHSTACPQRGGEHQNGMVSR